MILDSATAMDHTLSHPYRPASSTMSSRWSRERPFACTSPTRMASSFQTQNIAQSTTGNIWVRVLQVTYELAPPVECPCYNIDAYLLTRLTCVSLSIVTCFYCCSWIVYSAATFDGIVKNIHVQMIETAESERSEDVLQSALGGFNAFARALSDTLANSRYLCGDRSVVSISHSTASQLTHTIMNIPGLLKVNKQTS